METDRDIRQLDREELLLHVISATEDRFPRLAKEAAQELLSFSVDDFRKVEDKPGKIQFFIYYMQRVMEIPELRAEAIQKILGLIDNTPAAELPDFVEEWEPELRSDAALR